MHSGTSNMHIAPINLLEQPSRSPERPLRRVVRTMR